MAELTFTPPLPGRKLMLQFECGRCGKKHIEPFESFKVPEGWKEHEKSTPLLCPECHKAFKEFMKGGQDGSFQNGNNHTKDWPSYMDLPRNQEERSKGCGWCKQFAGVPLRGFTEHGCQSITVKFCPQCGRRLEEV